MKKKKITLKMIYKALEENPTASLREIYVQHGVNYEFKSIRCKMWKLAQNNKILYQYDAENQDYINIEVIDEKIINEYKTTEQFKIVERDIVFSHLNIIDELDKLIFNTATNTKDKLKAIELRQREYKYENNVHAIEYYKAKRDEEI